MVMSRNVLLPVLLVLGLAAFRLNVENHTMFEGRPLNTSKTSKCYLFDPPHLNETCSGGAIPPTGNLRCDSNTPFPTKRNAAKLTVAVMYYANPSLLLRHLNQYRNFSLSQDLEILIVDDGSPEHLRASEYIDETYYGSFARLRVAHITENIPWNTPQARNLAVYLAESPKIIMLDSDLLPLEATIEEAMTWETRNQTTNKFIAHSFQRLRLDGRYTVHPSAMMSEAKAWWSVGGYDEDLSGNYGYEDVVFWKRFEKAANYHVYQTSSILLQQEAEPCDEVDHQKRYLCENALGALPSFPKDPSVNGGKRNRKVSCWSNTFLRHPWTLYDLDGSNMMHEIPQRVSS